MMEDSWSIVSGSSLSLVLCLRPLGLFLADSWKLLLPICLGEAVMVLVLSPSPISVGYFESPKAYVPNSLLTAPPNRFLTVFYFFS